MVQIKVKTWPHFTGLSLPCYQTDQAAGADILAACDENGVTIAPGKRALLPTGLSLQLPFGYEAQIRPRSGLAINFGVTVLNSPGTIDADYRGELKVILVNLGQDDFTVKRGMRIAQMVISPVTKGNFVITDELEDSARADGGFGHTGV